MKAELLSAVNPTLTRRAAVVLGALAAATSVPTAARAEGRQAAAETKMFEHTYLKAQPGRREALARYIELNWFAMDKVGMGQGLFTSYELLVTLDENADWDLVMVVGYPQPEGFSDPKTNEAFMAIRRAHQEVPVEGQRMPNLGTIVRHHRLKVAARGAPHGSPVS